MFTVHTIILCIYVKHTCFVVHAGRDVNFLVRFLSYFSLYGLDVSV